MLLFFLGCWGCGVGDLGFGCRPKPPFPNPQPPIPNPQSPIPNPQSPLDNKIFIISDFISIT